MKTVCLDILIASFFSLRIGVRIQTIFLQRSWLEQPFHSLILLWWAGFFMFSGGFDQSPRGVCIKNNSLHMAPCLWKASSQSYLWSVWWWEIILQQLLAFISNDALQKLFMFLKSPKSPCIYTKSFMYQTSLPTSLALICNNACL